jgi:kynurenine/2-aminoadipate aminotransferase
MCVGNGSQDVLSKAFEMCLSSEDTLLIEKPTYVGSLAILKSIGCKLKGSFLVHFRSSC